MEYWFQGASNIVSINLNNLDASQVTSMKSTFKGCTALESLNLSSLKTANLKSMVSTFENTYSLGTLTLGGNFTTENVTAMDSLFVGEDAASTQSSTPTEIIGMKDSFKTENVKTIIKAFAYHKFTSLDFSGFKTINVGGTKGFASMFMGLQFESETELDVSSFETGENATILSLMFGDLVNVSSIKFGDGFTTDKATMFTGMFRNFKGKTLDLRYFNNTNVSTSGKALGQMFVGCTNLTKIIVDPEKWTDKSLTDASTFGSCFNLIGSNADGSITTSHGAGTDYDSGAYARVPSDGKPGLLTDKDAPKDSALNNNSADNNTQDDDIIDNDTDTNKDTNGGPSGLAAILGAPFAFGLMFGRRRVSEKHVKIK